MLKKTIAVLALTALGGCASIELGSNFDPVAFQASVQRGVTTQSEVHTLLGEPVSRGQIVDVNGNQYTRWLYYYAKGQPPKFASPQFKMLEIKFDGQRVVQGYNWSSTEP